MSRVVVRPDRVAADAHVDAQCSTILDLAGAGKHEEAVALTTTALASAQLGIQARAALLEARVRSLLALAEVRRAGDDAAELLALTESDGSAARRARALACQSLVLQRSEREVEALNTATAALEAARRSRQAALIALALLRQATPQLTLQKRAEAERNAASAARIFERLNDRVQQGRALRILGLARMQEAITDESLELVQKAIDLARATGDRAGEAAAYSAMHGGDPDLAVRLRGLKAALQANIDAGDRLAQANMLNNLSLTYARLGMYRRARRMILRCNAIKGRALRPGALVNGKNIQALLEMFMGHKAAADAVIAEERRLYATDPMPQFAQTVGWVTSFQDLLEGRYASAVAGMERLRSRMKPGYWVLPGLLGNLAQANLLLGDRTAALKASTAATVAQQEQHGAVAGGVQSDAVIWWQHHLALKANRKRTASWQALQRAYHRLVDGIATLTDEGLRRSYLHAPRQHATLMQAWIATARERGLPAEEWSAHLRAQTDLREPVARLVDTGLRLNALRIEDELHEFLIEEVAELVGAQRVLLVLEQPGGRQVAGSLVPRGEAVESLLPSVMPWLDDARSLRVTALRHTPEGAEAID
ncbi:MAG: hypothetical protein ABIP49_00690, partial [Lysobacterales bacterium]